MKANELRIGNWLHFNGNYLQVTAIRTLVKKPYFYIKVIGFKNRNIRFYGYELEPIPLTPEILDKIGERKWLIGDSEAKYWQIGGFLYNESEIQLSKGLHWLQNFHYFRTGEELEINLS